MDDFWIVIIMSPYLLLALWWRLLFKQNRKPHHSQIFVSFSMKHLVSKFALILILSNITAQDTRPSVAVLDFEARGIAVYEAETLTERLRSEISNTNAIRLTDRKLLEKI